MPIIKPVSDLRNYGEILRDVAVGQPVFLTKNGHGRYAVLDMEEYREYERLKAKERQNDTNTHEKLSNNARQAMELAMKLDDELTDEERRYLEDADENNPYFGVPQTPDSLLKFIRKDYPDWSFKRVRNFFHMPSGDWGLATERQPQEDQNPLSFEKLGRF